MSAKPETERGKFENWLRSKWTAGYGFPKTADGQYAHGEAQRFWECWQAALLAADGKAGGETLFWYRPRSDGLYEGPIHNAQIERVRKESGGWKPLYTNPQPQAEAVRVPDLAGFVNSADIRGNDAPHVVVQKLQRAMLSAAPKPKEK